MIRGSLTLTIFEKIREEVDENMEYGRLRYGIECFLVCQLLVLSLQSAHYSNHKILQLFELQKPAKKLASYEVICHLDTR